MTDFFEDIGRREPGDGEHPDHLIYMARFLLDRGVFGDISVEWPRLPPPASKEAVNNLPEVVVNSESIECPICLKIFNKNEKAKKMPCSHIFHASCIMTWLEETNSCPVCRYELPTDDEEYEAFKKEKKNIERIKEQLESLLDSASI